MKPQFTKTIVVFFFFSFAGLSYCTAQNDTLFINNQKIAATVKEITPEAIKYTYPNEDLVNSVYKNSVQKIIFKSGRIQTFAEATSFKAINGVMDYDKVSITAVENELKGLYKLGDVSAKAKGTTVFSNQEKVKERAYKKLKIQAAMMGANIVYLTAQRTEGNKYGSEYTSGSSTETNLTGIGYTNILPDFDEFKKVIGSKTDFYAAMQFKLWASDTDVSQSISRAKLTINNISNENGIVYIDGALEGEKNVFKFQLVNFTNKDFSIAYKYKGTAYNFTISL